jgi:hypothetical protein
MNTHAPTRGAVILHQQYWPLVPAGVPLTAYPDSFVAHWLSPLTWLQVLSLLAMLQVPDAPLVYEELKKLQFVPSKGTGGWGDPPFGHVQLEPKSAIFALYCEKGVELGTFMPLLIIAWRIASLVFSKSCSFCAMVISEAYAGANAKNSRNAENKEKICFIKAILIFMLALYQKTLSLPRLICI